MKRRWFLVLSAGCMMGLLSACGLPMSENVQVEELLRAPRLPGDYGALQNALNEWLGESAQLKYPMQGELLSPFLLQDLDGDGQQDAAVLYTTAQSSNEAKDEIGGMAMEIASKVVEREIKEADHKDLIDEFIKNVGEAS